MSDLALYENLAAAAIRRCGDDARRLRRALAGVESEILLAPTDEAKSGLRLIAQKLGARLDELAAPTDRERGP